MLRSLLLPFRIAGVAAIHRKPIGLFMHQDVLAAEDLIAIRAVKRAAVAQCVAVAGIDGAGQLLARFDQVRAAMSFAFVAVVDRLKAVRRWISNAPAHKNLPFKVVF